MSSTKQLATTILTKAIDLVDQIDSSTIFGTPSQVKATTDLIDAVQSWRDQLAADLNEPP